MHVTDSHPTNLAAELLARQAAVEMKSRVPRVLRAGPI